MLACFESEFAPGMLKDQGKPGGAKSSLSACLVRQHCFYLSQKRNDGFPLLEHLLCSSQRLAERKFLKQSLLYLFNRTWHAGCIKPLHHPNILMNNQHESTYALITRSEEKSRTILEIMLYAAFSLSTVIAICQFAQQPVKLPAAEIKSPPAIASEVQAATIEQS